jgi:hypothetical protein
LLCIGVIDPVELVPLGKIFDIPITINAKPAHAIGYPINPIIGIRLMPHPRA